MAAGEGFGDILYVGKQPKSGEREVTLDPDTRLVTAETMTALPEPYQLSQYGHQDKKVAITFDDGPDPANTPRILDILKREQAPATFFLIGLEVQKFPWIAQRVYQEGHAIGNHAYSHRQLTLLSDDQIRTEIFDGKVLRKDWINHLDETREIGSEWLKSQRSALLLVPSALVPATSNVLLNPLHPDAARIRIDSAYEYPFDVRIKK